jgi:hypothetical protein
VAEVVAKLLGRFSLAFADFIAVDYDIAFIGFRIDPERTKPKIFKLHWKPPLWALDAGAGRIGLANLKIFERRTGSEQITWKLRQLGLKHDNLRSVGFSDLPQSTQCICGFFNSLLLGHLRISLANGFVSIGTARARSSANPSQRDRVLSLQLLRTQATSFQHSSWFQLKPL